MRDISPGLCCAPSGLQERILASYLRFVHRRLEALHRVGMLHGVLSGREIDRDHQVGRGIDEILRIATNWRRS